MKKKNGSQTSTGARKRDVKAKEKSKKRISRPVSGLCSQEFDDCGFKDDLFDAIQKFPSPVSKVGQSEFEKKYITKFLQDQVDSSSTLFPEGTVQYAKDNLKCLA